MATQIAGWETEVRDLRERADDIDTKACRRVKALLNSMDSQMSKWEAESSNCSQPQAGVPSRAEDECTRSRTLLLARWQCELDELKATAFRADAQAEQSYRQRADALRAEIDRVPG
jgi:hypothetical protein